MAIEDGGIGGGKLDLEAIQVSILGDELELINRERNLETFVRQRLGNSVRDPQLRHFSRVFGMASFAGVTLIGSAVMLDKLIVNLADSLTHLPF